jgi:hypothetical protein
MKKHLILILVHLLLEFFLLTFAKKECVNSGVRSQHDDVTVTKGTRKEKGKSVEDIKVAKIKWRPNIENNKEIFDAYDLSKLELDVRIQDGAWETFVPPKEVKYLGYYEWKVPRIPCRKYGYKIFVPSKTQHNAFLCTTETYLNPETKDAIRKSKFEPEPPTHMAMDVKANRVSLMWNRSHCAEQYEVYADYTHDTTKDFLKHKIVQQETDAEENNVHFDSLESCTSYQVEIYANLKGDENVHESFKQSFQTLPDLNTASHLDLKNMEYTSSSSTLRFFTYMDKVSCLNEFIVETCRNDDDCFQLKDVIRSQNHEELKYTSNGLDHCTTYFLKVQPKYHGVYIKPTTVLFTTPLNETKTQINPIIEQRDNMITVKAQHIDCFDSFILSYRHKAFEEESDGDGDWKEVSGKRNDGVLTFNNIQLQRSYQIKITAYTIHGSGKLLIFEANSASKIFKSLTNFVILLSCCFVTMIL